MGLGMRKRRREHNEELDKKKRGGLPLTAESSPVNFSIHSSKGHFDTSLDTCRRHFPFVSTFLGIGTDKSKNGSKQNVLQKKIREKNGVDLKTKPDKT